MGTKLLGAADILGADDIKTERVSCPEWGGDVLIKTMTGAERDAFELSLSKDKKGKGKAENDLSNIRARYVAATAVDAKGVLLFTQEQVEELGKKNAKALDRCFDVARELNGMLKETEVEEAKGNS